jgi:hypothetical protein
LSNGIEIREVSQKKNECAHIILHGEKGEASLAVWGKEERRYGCLLHAHGVKWKLREIKGRTNVTIFA